MNEIKVVYPLQAEFILTTLYIQFYIAKKPNYKGFLDILWREPYKLMIDCLGVWL